MCLLASWARSKARSRICANVKLSVSKFLSGKGKAVKTDFQPPLSPPHVPENLPAELPSPQQQAGDQPKAKAPPPPPPPKLPIPPSLQHTLKKWGLYHRLIQDSSRSAIGCVYFLNLCTVAIQVACMLYSDQCTVYFSSNRCQVQHHMIFTFNGEIMKIAIIWQFGPHSFHPCDDTRAKHPMGTKSMSWGHA